MTNKKQRVITLTTEDFNRLEDGEVITHEFEHMKSVTLVSERFRPEWESPLVDDRPENNGNVVFLSTQDYQQIKYSHNGYRVDDEGIVIAHESKEHLVFNEGSNQPKSAK